MTKIGFIGAGNMGSALARAASRAASAEVYIFDKDTKKAEEVAKSIGAFSVSSEVIGEICDFIFLAVKPNVVPAVVKELRTNLKGRKDYTLVSMAAGVSNRQRNDSLLQKR